MECIINKMINQFDNRKYKIAKITLNGYLNYGNVLQNYALQQVLLRYAACVDTIWCEKDNFLPRCWWKWSWKELIKFVLNWRNFRGIMQSGSIGFEMARQAKIRDFSDRYIHYRYDVKDFAEIDDEYDAFFVGSDQVWNPIFAAQDEYFLGFASERKRLSYAASISMPDIPETQRERFIHGIMGMHSLSVREQAGADLIQKMTGRKAEVHVDPTLLLTADEWRAVSRMPAWYHGEEYVLTYFLGKRPPEVDKILTETGLRIVNLLDMSDYVTYATGVDEFIWAIEHANLIYTDSFHGTVFSILFKRPFVVCNRIGNATEEGMGSRLDTLLDYFNLANRRAGKKYGYCISAPMSDPDWSKVEPALARERVRSDAYLRKVIAEISD